MLATPLGGLAHGTRGQDRPANAVGRQENGELLALVARHFDVFITVDQSLPHQQNLRGVGVALIVLKTKSNKLEDIVPHLPEILITLRQIQPGQLRRIPVQ